MKLLALDASTEACTVAVAIDGRIQERFTLGGNHSERILPMVQELLAEGGVTLKQLDAIAFGRGPGSFTGLRIAAGVTQGLAFGADVPVVAISSLAILAQGVDADRILAAFDARMQQVYWGAYVRNAEGYVELQGTEVVVAPSAVPLPTNHDWVGAGSGWDQYHTVLNTRLANQATAWRPQRHPHAADLVRLAEQAVSRGNTMPPDQAVPVYIRDDVATTKEGRAS